MRISLAGVAVHVALLSSAPAPATSQELGSLGQPAAVVAWGPASNGWQLGLGGVTAGFTTCKPIAVVAFVKNGGPGMMIEPLESSSFSTTQIDQRGELVAGVGEMLNTTGHSGEYVDSGSIVKTTLHIDARYQNLAPGKYRLSASVNVIQGTMMDSATDRLVVAHLISGTIVITILPCEN